LGGERSNTGVGVSEELSSVLGGGLRSVLESRGSTGDCEGGGDGLEGSDGGNASDSTSVPVEVVDRDGGRSLVVSGVDSEFGRSQGRKSELEDRSGRVGGSVSEGDSVGVDVDIVQPESTSGASNGDISSIESDGRIVGRELEDSSVGDVDVSESQAAVGE